MGWTLALLAPMTWADDEEKAEWHKAQSAFENGRWPDAESILSKLWNQVPAPSFADEPAALLVDVYLRQEKTEQVDAAAQRFKRQFPASPQLARVLYDQGLLSLKKGMNFEAAREFSSSASRAKTPGVYNASIQALHHIVEARGLSPEQLESVWRPLAKDPDLGPWLLEGVGVEWNRSARFKEAEATYTDYLQRYPQAEGASRVRGELARIKAMPRDDRTVLLMAPFSGDFSEVGRSLREGVSLAFEEAKAHGTSLPNVQVLDDQGNLVQGVLQLRKMLAEDHVDAILGPAMSDVAAGVAIELSARKSPVPLVTPTATTHGIASLGEGVFQFNVTTHVLGQRIAGYAFDCLGLKNFVVVAPHSEYGFQLTEAFAETVKQRGGNVIAAAYVDPDAADLSESLQEMRRKVAQFDFDAGRGEGRALPDGRLMRSYMSDSTFAVDGIFIPAASGDEADKLASQVVFNKVRGQILGSSGWYDKAVLLKSSEASQGAYFSVDFQDQPKTEAYSAFSRAYRSRWKRSPDRVAALSYDAARFLLEGMHNSSQPGALTSALRDIHVFPGVLGDIKFDDDGVNRNTALFRLERRSFKEVQGCATAH
jgi:branched-chain amino acid transport system substrate-binding protein